MQLVNGAPALYLTLGELWARLLCWQTSMAAGAAGCADVPTMLACNDDSDKSRLDMVTLGDTDCNAC